MKEESKLIVLSLKHVIYIALFIILGIVLIVSIFCFLFPKNKANAHPNYENGIYSTNVSIKKASMDIAVTISDNSIQDLSIKNANEEMSNLHPLLISNFEDIRKKILSTQSLDISYPETQKYSYAIILDAISQALDKAVK